MFWETNVCTIYIFFMEPTLNCAHPIFDTFLRPSLLDLLVYIAECATFDGINMCNYENHRGMIAKLQSLAKRYPKLAKYNTVGKSVQGRQLGYIKISANVTRRTRNEPMFKFVGKIKL